MATNNLKFFHVSSLPNKDAAVVGGIYFDTTKGEISVYNGTDWEKYSGNVKNVTYTPLSEDKTTGNAVGGTLTITYFDNSSVTLDFSDVASKSQVATDIATALNTAKTYADNITVNGKGQTAQNITVGGADIKLTDYAKPDSTSAITVEDSVNSAIGKLEKKIENTTTGALTEVEAGNGISVTEKSGNKQTISVNIDSASETFLTVGAAGLKLSGVQDAIDTKIAGLKADDTAVTGKYVSSVSEANGVISVTRADLPVTGIATDDKILSLTDFKIGADLSLTYDSTAKKIYLYGKDSTDASKAISTIDCTDFIKDGMLNAASYSDATKKLTLSFNTDAGKENIDVDLSKLVDTYVAGDGLDLVTTGVTHPTFKIKKNGNSDYLSVTSDGLAFSDAAIHTKIDNKITAAINDLNGDPSNDAADSGDTASSQIKVQVTEVAGKLTGVAVTAPIFATPADISGVEVELIGSDKDASTADTIWGAKKYAEEKASSALATANTNITNAIQALDKTVNQTASATEGLTLQVVQEDGLLKSVSGSMNWCEW